MLNFVRGCIVKSSEKICDQYGKNGNMFIANINAEKIGDTVERFIERQTQQLFFVLEVPLTEQEEKNLRKGRTDRFHKAVYYIDGLNISRAKALMSEYGELLIHDGLSSFGFGVRDNSAEIMCNKYNVLTIYAKTPADYGAFFVENKIPFTDNLITAWDTFNTENYGECRTITVNGKSVYDIIVELKDMGIYLAEIRED